MSPTVPTEYQSRVEALKIALQTMPQDRVRDAADLIRRAEVIYEFLHPAGGSREASGSVA